MDEWAADDERFAAWQEAYRRHVVEGVGAAWDPPDEGDWLQLLFLPSFDPELVVTVSEHTSHSRLQAPTAQCSLWLHFEYGDTAGFEDMLGVVDPVPVAVDRPLETTDASHIWRAAHALTNGEQRLGLDGTTIVIRMRIAGESRSIEAWSPPADAPERALSDLVLRLTREAADPAMCVVLDAIAVV